ncbi:MAG TPA: translocation/assembly module TamB domain-containing protein, partial [Kofleriaceae bacterium]|nr:translocation/assembly module TamB domain-containing protein [Kofleriaceae bacterium]
DAAGSRADAKVRMASVEVTLAARSPLTIDGALAGGAKTAKLDATLTIPKLGVRELLGLAGRANIVESGDIGGTVTIGGTVSAPTMRAQLSAQNLTLIPTIAAKKPPKLEKLDIDARWAANHGEIDVIGFETGGKFLKVSGRGTVGQPQSVVASIEALGFDIAPLVAFAPGILAGAGGSFDAALTVRGVDPQTGDVRGKLHITQGRLPLAPALGTLRAADIDITIAKQDVKADISAKLGAGSISGKATAKLQNGLPAVADVSLELRKLAPIGAIQPQIDANVTSHFTRVGTNVTGKISITKGKVYVPPEGGDELLATGTPSDMIFVDQHGVIRAKPGRRPRTKPWLVANIDIGPTKVYVDDPNALFDGVARGSLVLTIGDVVNLNGAISTERGVVDVLGRRYQLDHAVVDFDGTDGTLDPRLDIKLIHDFKDLTLTVDIEGRASNPVPHLSGDPATYTEGQLFAFLAGAEPGDDAGSAAGNAVAGASLTLLSSRIGRKINKYLPVKFDTLNYEAETAGSSRAVRAGIRLSDRSHIVWRQHIEARPDENPGEAVFEFMWRPWALIEATAGERAGGGDLLLRKRW